VLRTADFELTAVRLVAFTPNRTDFKPSAILATVLGKYAKRFDGPPQALPLPEDAPPEFPRIRLTSADGSWGFAASLLSITSSWSLKQTQREKTTALRRVVAACREPVEHHIHENDVRVGRLGLVITRVCRVGQPAQTLIERFCRDEVKDPISPDAPLRNSRNFELHNHKRYALSNNLTVNSWVRCKTGTIGKDTTPVVTVEQDINTLAEETEKSDFKVEEIASFLNMSVNESETVLGKYFP
jgi:hypothetical protein